MINSVKGKRMMTIEEAKSNYSICCGMLRAGLGREMWTAMRMTYAAAAKFLETSIREMIPRHAEAVIAEIRNEDY